MRDDGSGATKRSCCGAPASLSSSVIAWNTIRLQWLRVKTSAPASLSSRLSTTSASHVLASRSSPTFTVTYVLGELAARSANFANPRRIGCRRDVPVENNEIREALRGMLERVDARFIWLLEPARTRDELSSRAEVVALGTVLSGISHTLAARAEGSARWRCEAWPGPRSRL